MVSLFSTLVLAFAAVASAIQVTTPAVGALVDLSKDVNVAWTTVSTDPTSFSLFLVNNVRYPPSSVKIADGVSTSARNYTIKGGSISATSGSGYQISVQNVTPGQLGTLALSGQFNITGAAASGSGSKNFAQTFLGVVLTLNQPLHPARVPLLLLSLTRPSPPLPVSPAPQLPTAPPYVLPARPPPLHRLCLASPVPPIANTHLGLPLSA